MYEKAVVLLKVLKLEKNVSFGIIESILDSVLGASISVGIGKTHVGPSV